MDARLQTAVSVLSEYSIISVHCPVKIPLKTPMCLFGSVKQYVSSILLLFLIFNILINCLASRDGLFPEITNLCGLNPN